MAKQQLISFEKDPATIIQRYLRQYNMAPVFILTDSNTTIIARQIIPPSIYSCFHWIEIEATDENKNLSAVAQIWNELSSKKATRKSLLINIGGGMVCDIGGFAAGCFKRGMDFINIPTTLLAMVDAAVGGKTGFNFNSLKNEIGLFYPAQEVVIHTPFLTTLDTANLLSGYAEMIKHALLSSSSHWQDILTFDPLSATAEDWNPIVRTSIHIKEEIVRQDPTEQNIRKGLNLGHTVGHAFESLALDRKKPILHGYAVAFGLICELYLSFLTIGLSKEVLTRLSSLVKELYGGFYFECKEYDLLFEKMQHDKKNDSSEILFTLLRNVGEIEINQKVSRQQIDETFDFFRESIGL